MTIVIGNNLVGVDRCPQCNIAKPLLVYRAHVIGKSLGRDVAELWFVYQCSSCNDIVCAKTFGPTAGLAQGVTLYLHQSNLRPSKLIPDLIELDTDLPERPRVYLQQAINSRQAPDGAAMLAGSAIDAMLKIKGLTEGSLYSRIDQAARDNMLTMEMAAWAHSVRIDSNNPRHADLADPHITASQAEQAVDFARALGDFLFVFPARIARGRQAVDAATA